jgi:6-phosphogluconolactonase
MIYQTDERVVSLDSEDSNYYWIKKLLGHSRAALKPFYNGYSTQKSTQSYDLYLKEGFNVKDYAFDLLLLGFGDDGHIASIFPGKENPKSEDNVLYIPEKQNGFKRLTLSLSKLKCSKTTFIISYGEKKQRVLEKGSDLPIHKFLHNQMNVIWFHKG